MTHGLAPVRRHQGAIPGISDVMLTRRLGEGLMGCVLVSSRWFHARARVAFWAEEFDGRVEVVPNRAIDLDDFNRPVG